MNGRKMSRMKSIFKKWHSFANGGKTYASLESSSPPGCDSLAAKSMENAQNRRSNASEEDVPEGFLEVFVGRDQRRYVISERLSKHPVFRSLMQKIGVTLDEKDKIKFPCEVVLFDHLLWMLENDDPGARQADSVDELVEFYSCS